MSCHPLLWFNPKLEYHMQLWLVRTLVTHQKPRYRQLEASDAVAYHSSLTHMSHSAQAMHSVM